MTDLRERIAEIDATILRGGLTHLQYAEHLAERRSLYEALHPKAIRHGGDRRSDPRSQRNWCAIASSSTDAAAALGVSKPTIRRALRRVDRIPEDLRLVIADMPAIADSRAELDLMATLPAGIQRLVLLRLRAGKAKTVREALSSEEVYQ
jgi:ParB family chromosome partitioning protein